MDPFDFNWRHLCAIPVIAERRSISAAAAAVNLSQPALTKGLAKVEGLTRTVLFARRADGLEATDDGRTLIGRVQRASEILEAMLATIAPRGGRASGQRSITRTHMRAMLALADAGSFVGAALATGLSEPALHRAVRELEQVVGAGLVERRGRGVQLTERGGRLARAIRLASREVAAGLGTIMRDDRVLGPVLIGAMPLARARILPLAVAALHREDRVAEVRIIEGARAELIEPLRDGSIDLMLGALRDSVTADLVEIPLFNDRLVVVGRIGHPLAGSNAGVDQLAQFPWIVGAPGAPLHAQWEALFAGRTRPAAPVSCGSVVAIRRMLSETDLLTLLSPDQIDTELAAGLLATVSVPPTGAERRIGITIRAGWRPTATQQRLIELLHGEAERTIPERA